MARRGLALSPVLVVLGAASCAGGVDRYEPAIPAADKAQIVAGGERVNHLSVHLLRIDGALVAELPKKGKLSEVVVEVGAGPHTLELEWREYTSQLSWGKFSWHALTGSENEPATYEVDRTGRTTLELEAEAGHRYHVRFRPEGGLSPEEAELIRRSNAPVDRDRWRVEVLDVGATAARESGR